MAAITTAGSGNWSSTTAGLPWPGGVVPTNADTVTIASGHTVTVDTTTATAGGETVGTLAGSDGGIVVASGGVLKFSRSVNSTLTCRGTLTVASGGLLDMGQSGDSIPAGVTATLVGNDSSVIAAGKYIVRVKAGGKLKAYSGVNRTRHTTLVNALSAGVNTALVADATNWAIGDVIVLACSRNGGSYNDSIERTITGITPGTGTQATIIWSGGNTAVAYAAGGYVGNFTSNVVIDFVSASQKSSVQFHFGSSSAANDVVCNHLVVRYGGSSTGWVGQDTVYTTAAFTYYGADSTGSYNAVQLTDCMIYNAQQDGWRAYRSGATLPHLTRCGFYAAGYAYQFNNGATSLFDNCVTYKTGNPSQVNQFEYGSSGSIFNSCVFQGSNSNFLNLSSGSGDTYNDCFFGGATGNFESVQFNGGSTYNRCYIGVQHPTLLGGAGLPAGNLSLASVQGAVHKSVFNQCRVAGGLSLIGNRTLWSPTQSQAFMQFVDHNGDVTDQRIYYRDSTLLRDNATLYRGRSSISFQQITAGVAQTYSTTVPSSSGVAVRIVGNMRYDGTYAGTKPTITISGLGITPVSYTMTGAANTWEKFDLSATQTSGSDGNLTVTFTIQSGAANGIAWLDGVPISPFVTWVQHYGFTYDAANVARTVDPVVQLSEAAASALTGISYAGGALTISGTRSIREVYDWLKWYEASNQLAPIITSSDGVAFTLAANLTITGSITGSGTLALGANVLTMSGSSSVDITHSGGAKVWTRIAVAGLVAGSRVRVYDSTSATELLNAVVAGTSTEVQKEWSADHTLDVRGAYCSGTTAYLPFQSAATFSSRGASVTVSQSADTVYNTLAIDGSSCDAAAGGEFTADFPDVWVDVSDSDNVTTFQRLYAWMVYTQSTASGIVTMFDAITSSDGINFLVDSTKVDLHLFNTKTTPLIISGGYLYRSDGATVIAATSNSIQLDPGKAYAARDLVNTATRLEKFARNKRITDPNTGSQIVYEDDGLTIFATGRLYEDIAAQQPYRGQGADRAERLA